jgi:hypothetical protein
MVKKAMARFADAWASLGVDAGLEAAALVSDAHWPESGHVHQEDAVSCPMSISVQIRRMKSTFARDPGAAKEE